MNDYLSIGEVARLKKITVKALRYYEKIGILLPAYVNHETGYRYYTMEQMVVLDFILTCVELGIPLKRFPTYLDEKGVLDIDLILQDGTRMAEQEIARINRTVAKLNNMSRHLEESESLSEYEKPYAQFYQNRYLLLEPMDDLYPTQKQYIQAMTELYCRWEKENYTSRYKQGLLYMTEKSKIRCFAYNEMECMENQEKVFILPEGSYTCRCFRRARGSWLEKGDPEFQLGTDKRYILLQERYERHLSEDPLWEVQML
ncbi:MAG: MerR family DNA-binding transcriptional regulator [Acetatifactor sp.]